VSTKYFCKDCEWYVRGYANMYGSMYGSAPEACRSPLLDADVVTGERNGYPRVVHGTEQCEFMMKQFPAVVYTAASSHTHWWKR
jgi:hypothetical protein